MNHDQSGEIAREMNQNQSLLTVKNKKEQISTLIKVLNFFDKL
jgi:hypothetical protein